MKTKFNGILTLLLAFVVQISFAQGKTISGTITDGDSLPLPGVNVVVKGTSNGTTTDFDGNYSISANTGDVLVFSYVGSTQEETVGAKSNISFSISENALEEVVIVGFGEKKREDLSSAVSTLNSAQIEKLSPTTSLDNILQGVAPGVQVVAANGKPGQTAFVRIRGIGSINASSAPLYIIDGVVAPDLNSINPNDVQSMSILKDAATSSLYGSRAANGVVIIKTKSGRLNRDAQVTLSSRFGFGQRIQDNFDLMNAAQKIQYERELSALGVSNAAALPGASVSTPAEYNALIARDTNWEDELLRGSTVQTNTISIDGGTDKTSYFVSLGHTKDTGIIKDISGFERINGRLNLDIQAKEWFKVSANLSITTTSSDEPRDRNNVQNPFRALYDYNPYETKFITDDNGNPILDAEGQPQFNPTRVGFSVSEALVNNPEEERFSVILGGVTGVVNFTDKITNTFKVGATSTAFRRELFVKPGSILDGFVGDVDNPGSKTDNGSSEFDYTVNNVLNYSNTFGELHNVSLSGLFEFNKRTLRTYLVGSAGFSNDFLSVQSIATLPTDADTNLFTRALLSYGGFLDYNYDSKYLVTGSIRRDGSSTFGSDKRFGEFWSASAAWNISKESFVKDIDVINDLKLRYSIGTSGNSNGLASFASIATLGFGSLNGLPTAIPTDNGNSQLGFEKNKIWDIGLEFGLFNRKLRGVIDYYERTTSDLLLNAPLSSLGGEPDGVIFSNIGSMVNKGWEFELSGDIIKSENFDVTLGANIAFVDNEVTGLVDDEDILRGSNIVRVGETINTFNLVRWAGVNPANGQPLWYDIDGNVTNEYNADDLTVLSGKSPLAKFDGGVNLFVRYKNFDLTSDFYYKVGNYALNFQEANALSDGVNVDSNQRLDAFNYWRNPGDTNVLPSPLFGNEAQNASDRWLQKGDYVRLRNLTIGFNLPREVASKINLKSLRLFVQGQNLWTFAPYFNGDPEIGIGSGETANAVGFGNFNLYSYPQTQSVSMGINLKF